MTNTYVRVNVRTVQTLSAGLNQRLTSEESQFTRRERPKKRRNTREGDHCHTTKTVKRIPCSETSETNWNIYRFVALYESRTSTLGLHLYSLHIYSYCYSVTGIMVWLYHNIPFGRVWVQSNDIEGFNWKKSWENIDQKNWPVFSLISQRTLNSAGFIRWQFNVCFL